nr:hypothetical protein BaRGS_005418 [Batillaria attramentaria]
MRVNQDSEQPAENFRALPLIPTERDLTSDEQVFLRRNKETGRYQNLEEYLDIQFRLFRADFILPLRESIEKFLGNHDGDGQRGAGSGGRGIRVYHDVQIMRPVCTDREIAYRLSFDAGRLGSVDWRATQRLKYGSLVCLSRDNFQTYICAVVQEREPALLSNGLVDVVFILDRDEIQKVTESSRDHRFVMVESPAYFEAYRHVLQGLKNLNNQNFPFVQYIVDCNPAINPPAYLQRGRQVVRYDFRPLLDDNFVIKDPAGNDPVADLLAGLHIGADDDDANRREVEVMSGRDWPTFEELKLDDSQYNALHNALTREFAIIQGPPGTGKTYLGLKILKMLLHNSQHWNDPVQKKPMLIVCYTNHALDQFLEGILQFFKGTLVRVGARSKSEMLKECSLNNYRTRARENRRVPMEVHEAKMRVRDELRALRLEIHVGAAKLEIAEQEVVREFFLESHIDEDLMKSFGHRSAGDSRSSMMLKWLKLENLHERLVEQAEHRLNKLPAFRQSAQRGAAASAQTWGAAFDDEEDVDEDEDEEMIDITASVRDNHQSRRLDDDDDDDDFDFDLDLNLDGLIEMDESDTQKVRRLLRQLETDTCMLRDEAVALSITSFCDRDETGLKDKTRPKPSREHNKEVAETFRKLRLQCKRMLQGQLRSTDRMSEDEALQVQNVWKLPVKQRWRLYRYWVDRYCRQMRGEMRQNEENYHNKVRK